jgi:AcrR family transcriptional regulator
VSSTTPIAPNQRQRRKETRPQELLDAALALFVEKGFAATRSDDVAQRAGVAKGTLYLYYPSKEDLLKAVVRNHLSNLIAEGAELVEHFEGPTAELLRVLMDVWWQRVGNTPAAGITKVMMAEARNFPELAQFYSDEVIVPAHMMVRKALQRGIARGEVREVPLDAAASAIMAPMIFLALHRHSIGACQLIGRVDVDHRQVLETSLDLALHGLLARGDSGEAGPAA